MTRTAATRVSAAVLVTALALGACHRHERKVKAETGTAEAVVTTKAPVNTVSNSDLQQQAQSAADAASTPVANTAGPAPANATR